MTITPRSVRGRLSEHYCHFVHGVDLIMVALVITIWYVLFFPSPFSGTQV